MSLSELLFESEAELREAASVYAGSIGTGQTPKYRDNARKRLRDAAIAYARTANHIDDLGEKAA